MKRGTFRGVVEYAFDKPEDAKGVLLENIDSIIQSFHIQSLMRPHIKDPCGHIPVSYSPEDKGRLTDKAMVILAREYMQEMGVKDTQYIVVRHFDNGNPHVHIIYNRIDNNGKTISDSYDFKRNEEACKKLKDKYRLTYGEGKDKVKRHRLKGKDKVKYEIYDAIKEALDKQRISNWKDFEKYLKSEGIEMQLKYKSGTNEIQGISFRKGKIKFKGSEIDRSFSYSKLDKQLQGNLHKTEVKQETAKQSTVKQAPLINITGSIAPGSNFDENLYPDEQESSRKKKRKKGRKI